MSGRVPPSSTVTASRPGSDGARSPGVVPAGGPPRLRSPGLPHRRVLLVDDDFHARNALEELFAAYGYETTLAKDGEEALALLRGPLRIHFIVLDLMMPRLSGYEFLRLKKALPEPLQSVPVAVWSAVATCFVGGVVATFCKPAPVLELLAVADRYCRFAHGEGGAAAS